MSEALMARHTESCVAPYITHPIPSPADGRFTEDICKALFQPTRPAPQAARPDTEISMGGAGDDVLA